LVPVFFSLLLALPVAAQAQGGDATRGKAAYLKAGCQACHGTMGQGAPGPRLAPRPLPSAAFISFVRKGKVSGPNVNRNWAGMPPYSTKFLSDAELTDLYAYIASIPEPPALNSIPQLAP
jgi:mono/diheme cytochrome c family protein